MAEAMRIRAAMQGDRCVVRVLVAHEMESGQRREGGKLVPAWFIQSFTVAHNGRTVLTSQWGPAVAKNPLVQFSFAGAKSGDTIQATWIDNRGERRSDEAKVA